MSMKKPYPLSPARRQRGIILAISMVMMAVIAISSTFALKAAMTQDYIGAGQRARSQALQAAEAALRYCEAAISAPTPTPDQLALVVHPVPEDAADVRPMWQRPDTWNGANAGRINVIPNGFAFAPDHTSYNRRPECVIDRMELRPVNSSNKDLSPVPFTITARGFSPDFDSAADGTPTNGAVVRIQSVIQVF